MKLLDRLKAARADATEELDALRSAINQIPGHGEVAQPRMALTVAALEIVHRVYGGYAQAHLAYTGFVADLGWPDPPSAKNFTNFMSRHTATGESFDLFEALLFILQTDEANSAAIREKVRPTLTPYQKYLIGWGRACIEARTFQLPRLSTDLGPDVEAEGNGRAGYRVADFVADVRRRQQNARLETLFGGEPECLAPKCTFVCFRAGLTKPDRIVQSFLALLDMEASSSDFYTFAHVYRNLAHGGPERISRGIVIPGDKNVYLLGFMSARGPVEKDMTKNTMDLVVLPRSNVSENGLITGLTLSANAEDKPMASRIVLRRTSLDEHTHAGVDVYPASELHSRLALLKGVETGASAEAPRPRGRRAATLTIAPEIVAEASAIAERTNNLTEWVVAELLDNKEMAYAAEHFRRAVLDIFLDPGTKAPLFHDNLQRPYSEHLHQRHGALSPD